MSFASQIKRKIMQKKLKKVKGRPLFAPTMNLSGAGYGFMPSSIGDTISHRPTVGRALDGLESQFENLRASAKKSNKPNLIIANTIKGKGLSIMENDPVWHVKKLTDKNEIMLCKKELGL